MRARGDNNELPVTYLGAELSLKNSKCVCNFVTRGKRPCYRYPLACFHNNNSIL